MKLALCVLSTAVLAGCTDTDDPAGPLPPKPAGLVAGIGVSPHSWTIPAVLDAFEMIADSADVALVQIPFAWDQLHGRTDNATYRDDYGWMVEPDPHDNQNPFQRHSLGRAFWLNFLSPGDPTQLSITGYAGTLAFTNPDVAASFIDECVLFADDFQPDFLAIGTEIDAYLQASSVDERAALLGAISTTRSLIKARHPQTAVFVYFQFEHVRANDLWDIIRPFAEASDMAAFSSYPATPLSGPGSGFTAANLPDDYYAAIRQDLSATQPIAFVELGHPATPSSLFSAGSESEQAALLRRFFEILPAGTALAVWTHLYDPDLSSVYAPDVAAFFGSTGLLRRDSLFTTSPSWRTWTGVLRQ